GEIAGEVEDPDARERLAHEPSRLAFATAFTTSNSLRRSAIWSGESLPASRYFRFQAGSFVHVSGDATVVRAAGAPSSSRSASSRVRAWDSTSKGRRAAWGGGWG